MLPFLKYVPFFPESSSEIQPLVDRVVSKRREEMKQGIHKKDLLQIFIDAHDADPIEFSNKHIMQEMIVFMFV
jgi:cytochrome P450